MTVLSSLFDPKKNNPCNRADFFSDEDDINNLRKFEKRELPPIGKPEASCTTNLFLGFFFDGTRNNYRQAFDEGTEDFSNVARLYDSFPGMSVPGVLPASAEWQHEKEAFKHFFKVYVPGVGSAFEQVGDKGGGTLGAAAALYGEIRIVWGLAQAMNCLNRFFTGQLLINDSEIKDLTKRIKITQWELRRKAADSRPDDQGRSEESSVQILNSLLKRLHTSLDLHMRKGSTNKPAKTDPGIVDTLHFSCFGFSRGATEARVFFNWLRLLCQLDSELCEKPGQLTLAGFPVQFDFLGLFDTVASVGLASSSVLWDGHGGWADAEWSLRVHPEVECLHLVAAHEARRSFPLDSIQVGGSLLSGKHAEIMLPGVHSDVGGGYSPKTQGRGISEKGADMLSRIPLAMMYRKARLSGVPLKAEVANTDAKYRFEIDAALITAFNAYLEACPLQSGSYKELLHDQYLPYIAWRLSWLDKQDSASLRAYFPNLKTTKQYDLNNLVGGNQHLAEQVKQYKEWYESVHAPQSYFPSDKRRQTYNPSIDPRQLDQWEDIQVVMDSVIPELKAKAKDMRRPAADYLFANYVHDSFAGFPMLGKELKEIETALNKLSKKDPSRLSDEEKEWVANWQSKKEVPDIPTTGLEPLWLGAGYLRFRKVYAGADNLLISKVETGNDITV